MPQNVGMSTDREALAAAIAERYREILPPDEFSVDVHGHEMHVKALGHDAEAGSEITGPGFFVLHVPLPKSLRVHASTTRHGRSRSSCRGSAISRGRAPARIRTST